ncbi:MAG: helix-turn-helix domain-containing protein [Pseudonocardiales bacterium]|nr:helix-turn-helix domain-containing protein [Pseudonocardiales bacterium]
MTVEAGTHTLPASTLRRLALASGGLATASVAEMERRYPWFRRLSADQRAGVLLITQASVANFVEWLKDPQHSIRRTIDAFRTAPRDLTHWVSLRQTVELIRVATLVFEQQLPELAADDAERAVLTEASLRYSREVAFTAASTYAGAAEARGAWDARLEALVVDGIMRGDGEESLLSRAAALGLEPTAPATVLVGNPPPDEPPELLADIRGIAVRSGGGVLVGVQGSRLVLVASGSLDLPENHRWMIDAFGEGPVVVGPTVPSLAEAHRSAADALSGLRAVAAWPTAPRPVPAAELLPERALAGDPEAERLLVDQVMRPLTAASGGLVETLDAFFSAGGVLEACARQLFVHPNTVRYRLRRIADITGRVPGDPRDGLVLQVGLAVGRLARSRGLW